MRRITLILGFCLLCAGWVNGQSTTFSYTGSSQMYVVPPGCNYAVVVDAYGAQGGGNTVSPGGLGGHTQATIAVTPGETLYVYVGGTGDVTGTAGYNGGGSGIGGSVNNPGSGGGGASDVRKGGATLNDRWVVGGGGGGGMENGGVALGGDGGGLIGASGNVGGNPWGCTPLNLPTGGTQSAGGLGGTSTSCAWNGFDGSFGQGGNSYNNYRSAGGGGGWYGGGGAHNGTSGAGGSSYAHPSATNVTHTQGAWTGNGQVVITLASSVLVDLGPDSLTCSGYVLDAGFPGATYLWSNNATSQTISVTASGTYSVVVTDTGGCTGQDTVSITISPPPMVQLGADTTVCDTLTLDAGNPGDTYLWSTNAMTQTIVVGPGTYSVTVTNGAGCAASDTIQVNLNVAPSVNLGGPLTGCDSLTLDAGFSGNAYLWSTGATSQTIVITTSGSYAVTMTQVGGCQFSSSDTVSVSIGHTVPVSFAGLAIAYCDGDPAVTLSGLPAGGVFSGPGISGNTFDPTAAGVGTHTITYTYTDSVGCTSTTSSTTLVDVCIVVHEPLPSHIKVFPNPNDGRFTVAGFDQASVMEVYNALGKKVVSQMADSPKVAVDISSYTKGVYFIRVQLDGKWYAGRVMLQ